MTTLKFLNTLSSDEITKMLTSLKKETEIFPVDKDESTFVFNLPFLTSLQKSGRGFNFMKANKKMVLNHLFNLFIEAQKDFKTFNKNKNTKLISLLKEFGVRKTKEDFSEEALENNSLLLNLTIPVVITSGLTVSGWLNLYVFAEDGECLQLGGGWIEHNHLEGNQKLWHFKNNGEELINDLKSSLSEILNINMPYYKKDLFTEFKQEEKQDEFKHGIFTTGFTKNSVQKLFMFQ